MFLIKRAHTILRITMTSAYIYMMIMNGAIILLLSGCLLHYEVPSNVILPEVKKAKYHLNVGLYLSSDMPNYSYTTTKMSLNVGKAICMGTESMLKLAFKDVTILKAPPIPHFGDKMDAIIIPKIIIVSDTVPMFIWQKHIIVIRMKYSMVDTNLKEIWSKDANGEIIGKGSRSETIQIDYFREALEKLLADALNEMLSSNEIRTYAEQMNR